MRSAERLNWRFADQRAGDFEILAVTEGEGLAGYAVIAARGRHGWVADVLALPGRRDVLDGLVGEAVRRLLAAGAVRIRAWLPGRHPFRPAFRAAGFVAVRRVNLMYAPLGATSEATLEPLARKDLRFHFMAGDADVV
jgi:hypothetical protein